MFTYQLRIINECAGGDGSSTVHAYIRSQNHSVLPAHVIRLITTRFLYKHIETKVCSVGGRQDLQQPSKD